MKNETIQTVILTLALLWQVAVYDFQSPAVPEIPPAVVILLSSEPVLLYRPGGTNALSRPVHLYRTDAVHSRLVRTDKQAMDDLVEGVTQSAIQHLRPVLSVSSRPCMGCALIMQDR